jgi:ATP-dependent Clp protease ATP-binding subunit ClpA
MFERFTQDAREVVIRCQEEARSLRHDHIGTQHLLLALLAPPAGIARRVLIGAGLDAAQLRTEVQRLVRTGEPILSEEDAAALRTVGIDVDAVLARIEASFGPEALVVPAEPRRRGPLRRRPRERRPGECRPGERGPGERGPGERRSGGHLPFTPRAKKVLELSLREAIRLKDRSIRPEHLLLGLLREGEGLAAEVLVGAGLSLDELRRATETAMREAA